MSKPKTQLNLKANERIKELVLDSGLTRERFAETINYTPQHLSRLLSKTNPTPVTIDTANRIAQVYHVRYEWVMGIDDYKTDTDCMEAQVERAQAIGDAVHCLFKEYCKDNGFSIKLYEKDDLEKLGLRRYDDYSPYYVVIRNDEITGMIAIKDYLELRHEILHYSTYLFDKIRQKTEKNLLKPIPLPEDMPNG